VFPWELGWKGGFYNSSRLGVFGPGFGPLIIWIGGLALGIGKL